MQCEVVLRALVAGLGSGEQEAVVVADCLCGLCTLVGCPGAGGSEVLAQRLLEAGLAPQLDGLWGRLLAGREEGTVGARRAPGPLAVGLMSDLYRLFLQQGLWDGGGEGGASLPKLGPLAMALCAGLVRLPGLAAALVAFEAPATLAAAAEGFAGACDAGVVTGGPALAVLRACAQELGGSPAATSPARVGCLAQVASRVLAGLNAQVDMGALLSTAGQEAVGVLADVLACAPAELVEAIDWADVAPKRWVEGLLSLSWPPALAVLTAVFAFAAGRAGTSPIKLGKQGQIGAVPWFPHTSTRSHLMGCACLASCTGCAPGRAPLAAGMCRL